MKKFFGWLFIVCGVLSLPRFFMDLARAQHGYEVLGLFIGQGLVFYLGYLCLRKTSKKQGGIEIVGNKEREEKQADVNNITNIASLVKEEVPNLEENHHVYVTSDNRNVEGDNNDVYEHVEPVSRFCTSELNLKTEQTIVHQSDKGDEGFPQIKYEDSTWEEIEDKLFKYQKEQFKTECSPSLFMKPYDYNKVLLANEILMKLKVVNSLSEMKSIREMAKKLSVESSTRQIYSYLTIVCNPENFEGKEQFVNANELYHRVHNSKENWDELEGILVEAKQNIILPKEIKNKRKLPAKKVIFYAALSGWSICHLVLWIYKGVLHNAQSYFFPIQTLNIKKYDFTEFAVYGLTIPALVIMLAKYVKYLSNRK